jgi:hypothetical protein
VPASWTCPRAVIDSSHVRALKTAQNRTESGRPRRTWLETPPDRRRGRRPLAVTLTGGNRNDVTQLIALIAAIPPIRGAPSRPRRRPERIHADRGYDHDKYRRLAAEGSRRSSPAVANPTVPAMLEDHTGLIRLPFQPTSFAVKLVEVMPVAHVTIDARLTRRGDARLCVRSPRWS